MSSQSSQLHAQPRKVSSHQQSLPVQGQNRTQSVQTSGDAQKQTKAPEVSKDPYIRALDAAQKAFLAAQAASHSKWKSCLSQAKPSSDGDSKSLYLKAFEEAHKACRSEFEKILSEARSSQERFSKDPYLKAFQVAQNTFRDVWSKGMGPKRPASELHDCATLIDILSQKRFSEIDNIVVMGLEEINVDNVSKALLKSLTDEIEPQDLKLVQAAFFRKILVLDRIRRHYKKDRNVDLKIHIDERPEFSERFKRVLRQKFLGFEMNVTEDSIHCCSKTTLLYDVRFADPGVHGFLKLLDSYGRLPGAVLTTNDSLRFHHEIRDKKVIPVVQKNYHMISLISLLMHQDAKKATSGKENKLALAEKETQKTIEDYARLSYSYYTPTFALDSDMVLLCHKDLVKLAPVQHMDPETLVHKEGFMDPLKPGRLDRGIVYRPDKNGKQNETAKAA